MLARRIIPCLDVDRGRVVKGIRFVDLIDAGDPVEQGRRYDREGADELVFLDITASAESRDLVRDMARHVADSIFIPFTVGGGIRTAQDMGMMLAAGADKISVNTAAIENPSIIAEGARAFGSQAIVVAIDARRRPSMSGRQTSKTGASSAAVAIDGVVETPRWEVYSHGGRISAGLDAVEWARQAERLGAGEILLTSMDRDGTRDGYDLELTRSVSSAVRVPVIASGGAGTLEHFHQAFVQSGASAALAASLFHFGDFKIAEVKNYLRARGVVMR